MLAQKPQPALSRAGRIRKNGSDASTSQKMPCDKVADWLGRIQPESWMLGRGTALAE